MFESLGRFVYRHRLSIIIAWFVVALAALPGVVGLTHVLKVGGFSNSDLEAQQVNDILEKQLDYPQVTILVTFHSETERADSPRFVQQVQHALSRVEKLPYVSGVSYHMYATNQVSRDRHTAYEVIGLDTSQQKALQVLPKIRRDILPTDLKVLVGGGPPFDSDVERLSQSDLHRAELIAFPIGLIALLLVFGSAVSATIPLVIGGFSVVVVLGAISGVARITDMSIFTMNVASMLGLGLAVDYSLFMVSRFREELATRSIEDALAITMGLAGKAVFFSGITVLVGLLGLTTFNFMILRSLGIAGITVVIVSLLGALTLLPAILALVGHKIDKLRVRVPLPRHRPFWESLSHWVMRHPVSVLVPTLVVLIAFGIPFKNVRLSSPDPTILPLGTPSREAFEQIDAEFPPGSTAPILIVFRSSDSILSPKNLEVMYALSQRLKRVPGVEGVEGIVSIDPRINLQQYEALYSDPAHVPDRYAQGVLKATTTEQVSLMRVATKYSWNDPRQQEIVNRLRNTRLPNGLTMSVGGAAAAVIDVVNTMYGEFPLALALVVIATYVILMLMLRSVLLPLKAVVMNSLSIIASYGALVWIFQEGHLSSLLRFQPLGYVETTLPIMMFCALFGLSMDYEVFLLSRIKEEWERTHDNTASVAKGLERSGRIITSAALIVVVVAMSFVTAQIVLIKALGLGVALAVLLDATLVRALLVPATMRLLGDWNWWAPGFIRGRHREGQKVKESSGASYGD